MCRVKIPYVEKDSIYYPVLVIPKDEKLSSVGKYGLLWLSYMKENHAGRLKTLRRLGSANRTAVQVNEEAYEMLDVIMNRYISNHKPDNRNSTMELWKIREQAVAWLPPFMTKKIMYGTGTRLPEKEVFMTENRNEEREHGMMERNASRERIPELLIAIDHGWSSIKTPNLVFENGVQELKTMPATKDNLLEYRGRKFVIGQGRMGKQESKTENENYYLLTLAAIAKEMKAMGDIRTARVNLAVGVPLTLYGKEKRSLRIICEQMKG